MYAATGDPRFKRRADYIVSELSRPGQAQGRLRGRAGRGRGIRRARERQHPLRAASISTACGRRGTRCTRPIAGLRDAYRYTGNRTALDVEIKFAAWAESILAQLNDEQTQTMLDTEFGGMNEVLADLYADTGDPRWLTLSYQLRASRRPRSARSATKTISTACTATRRFPS